MTDDARPPKGEAQNELVKLVEELHLPEEKKEEIFKIVLSLNYHEGWLPPAEEVARYQQLVPDAGDRVLKMMEEEQQQRSRFQRHMLFLESMKINGAIILGILLIGAAVVALYLNNTIAAMSLGMVGTLAAALNKIIEFLTQRKKR